jgi:hypothetical protein
MITALTGARAGGQTANFDFPAHQIGKYKGNLSALFGPLGNLRKAEAKRSRSEVVGAMQKKLANDVIAGKNTGVKVQRMAKGGPVGTDTVPALLTPGEFVVNKKSSQAIGYGNLSNMNRYAAGGKVGAGRHSYGPGGGGPPVLSFKGLDTVGAKLNAFGNHLDKIKVKAADQKVMYERLNKSLMAGRSNVDALKYALKGTTTTLVTTSKLKTAASTAAAKADQLEAAASKKAAGATGGMGMGIGMTTMMMASMATTMVDAETSTGKVVNALADMLMKLAMVMMALEMFGISLKMQSVMNMMPGKGMMKGLSKFGRGMKRGAQGGKGGMLFGKATAQKGASFMSGGKSVVAKGGEALKGGAKFGANLKSLAVGAAVAGIAFKGVTSIVDGATGVHEKAKKAIEEGNVAEAAKTAVASQSAKDANSVGMAMVGIGAMFGPLGAAIGFAAGGLFKLFAETEAGAETMVWLRDNIFTVFGAESTSLIAQRAKVEAGTVKTQKLLKLSGDAAAKALESVKSGAMTAAEAMRDPALVAAGESIVSNKKERDKLSQGKYDEQVKGMWGGGAVREIVTLGGMIGEGANERIERIEKEDKADQEATKKESKEAMKQRKPIMQARMRQVAAGGGDIEAFINSMDPTTRKLMEMSGETQQVRKSFENVKREADLMRKRIAALNLGMRDMDGRVAATTVGMNGLMDRFKTGGMSLGSSIDLIAAGMTEAGAHISEADFGKAVADVEKNFAAFGAGDKELKKFTQGLKATHNIQQNMDTIFDKDFKKKLNEDFLAGKAGGGSSDELRKRMADSIVGQLDKQGFGKDIQDQFRDIIQSGKLSDTDMKKLAGGDMSVIMKLAQGLTDEQVKILQETGGKLAKMNGQLESLTKDRIAAEREFISAQKQSIDMEMEARKISAKYGGAEFGTDEKRELLLKKANLGAGGMGIQDLQSGGLGEIKRRNAQIGMNFGNIEQARRRTDKGGDEMRGVKGQELQAKQDDLQKANKEHATLIRDLIKLEEEELQILEKKNALEKESLTSLMKGDLEGFLKQQAAVGATAAIATGDRGMMGMFGADALAGAFENIQKQQAGGVQSLYGQQLGGAGGLAERGAQAALGARGLKDLQSAQLAAGTTPEEEAKKRNIRGLAGALAETGDVGAAMAGMKVGTAEMRIDLANIEIVKLQDQGKAIIGTQGQQGVNPADPKVGASLSGGGLIYANNGVFVPRGTDTVPAMLTPGEFVVRRQSVQRGNNLQILRAMNGGEAGRYQDGGQVEYLQGGGRKGRGRGGASVGLDPTVVANLATSLSMFNTSLATNIQNLKDMKFQIKLDTTNVNVTLNGESFLASLSGALKSELMAAIGEKIKNTGFNSDGTMMAATGPLGDTQAAG